MREFRYQFDVNAPQEAVADFHHRADNVSAITPPPIVVRVAGDVPERMSEGDEMAFTMWLGPLPLRWRVRFEDITGESFVDRLLVGPFASWRHTHRFETLESGGSRVRDHVEAALRPEPWWRLIGGAMWLGLPGLFAYRAWKTRRLLERPAAHNGGPEATP